jgi:hypothetical protein
VRPDPTGSALSADERRPTPVVLSAAAEAQRRHEEAQARRYVASHALGAHLPGTVAGRPLVAIYDETWLLTALGLLEEEVT